MIYIFPTMEATVTIVLAMAVFAHVLLINAAFAAAVSGASLTEYLVPCKAKDPNLNECMKVAAQTVFDKLGKGIPELGLRPLDPVNVPKLEMGQGGAVHMNLAFTNSTHYGLGNIKVKSANADPENHVYKFRVLIPKYRIVGDYDISGRVILLPINGHGKSSTSFSTYEVIASDVEADWIFTGETEMRDGKKHLKLTKLKTMILPNSPSNVEMHFDGLFGGNKALGDTMNSFLNSNWRELTSQLKPNIQKTFDHRMLPVAQKFVSHFPLDEMFPDL